MNFVTSCLLMEQKSNFAHWLFTCIFDHTKCLQGGTYDSCKHVKSGNTRAVNLICDSVDCDLDDFYVSLGVNQYTDLKVFYEIYSPGSKFIGGFQQISTR